MNNLATSVVGPAQTFANSALMSAGRSGADSLCSQRVIPSLPQGGRLLTKINRRICLVTKRRTDAFIVIRWRFYPSPNSKERCVPKHSHEPKKGDPGEWYEVHR
jgi:hypothetical protein